MAKPNSQWVHRGRRGPWVISNDRFPNRLPAHPWAADVHPYVGRWVVPTTQRPALRAGHRQQNARSPQFLVGPERLTGCQKKAPNCRRWVVLMTQRPVPKRLLVFTKEGEHGQTRQSMGSQSKTWPWVISNDQFPNLATPAHP